MDFGAPEGDVGNAVWLVRVLPGWFFDGCLALFGGESNPILIVPFAGLVALIAGVVWGLLRRNARLLLFLVPPILSEAHVAAAGFLRGRLRGAGGDWASLGFLAAELIVCLGLIVWIRGARLPAALLALFSISYGLFAAFVATMAFRDSWI
jgi:hypothetical protein